MSTFLGEFHLAQVPTAFYPANLTEGLNNEDTEKENETGGNEAIIKRDEIYIADSNSAPEPEFVAALFLASAGLVVWRKRSC